LSFYRQIAKDDVIYGRFFFDSTPFSLHYSGEWPTCNTVQAPTAFEMRKTEIIILINGGIYKIITNINKGMKIKDQ